MTSPIRVGLIGLSKGGWAAKAHVDYLMKSNEYDIVAVCNGTEASAKEAIEYHELGAWTRAYGNPEGKF